MNITRISTLGAVALPRENSEVTYVRLCRWSNSTSPVCTSEVAPTLDVFTERGTSYLINLPSAGGRLTISTQLCNIRGCGDHVFWGTAGMARDGSFSFVATTYSTVSRVRPYVNTPSIARMTVTYSDGLVGTDTTCRGAGVCATNAYDPTPLGRVATIVSRGLEGNVLLSESVILRASQDARTSQVPDRLPRARDASLSQTPPVAATLVSTGQGSDGRLSFPITAPQSLSVLDVRTFSEVSAAIPTGASVKLTMNGGVLPPRTNVLLAVIADLSSLAAQAPPPAGSSFVFGVTTSAVNANGAVTPTGQVRGVWIVPGSMMAPDTVAADLSLAYWDGAGWVTVSDGTTSNSGSFVVDSWLSKLGTLVVLRRSPA